VQVTCAGIFVVDLIAADLPRVSRAGELTFAPRGIGTYIGGHSANVSIDLAKLGVAEGEVSCVGAVGEDLFGSFVEETLRKHRLKVNLQRTKKAGTSVDLILVVKGEDRRYHVDVGANLYLSPSHVLSVVRKENPVVFYVGATGLLGEFDTNLARILKEAKSLGCVTFVDPVVPYKKSWTHMLRAMEWIDVFHCNDKEASSITNDTDVVSAIGSLVNAGPRIVAVSLGGRGVMAATGDRLVRMNAFRVRVVDPTGAGDAFCAGTIYRLLPHIQKYDGRSLALTDDNLVEVLLEGEAAGAVCVTAVGTTSAVTRKNVDALLSAQGSKVRESVKIERI